MAKRMVLMLVVTGALVGALGFVKFRQIQTAIAQGAAFQPPPESVTTIVAQQVEWPNSLSAIGTAAAIQGVTVSSDLPGTIDRISFESGGWVRAGDVLVRFDARQERAQLGTIEAQRHLAKLNFARMKDLLTQRVISQSEYDRAMTDQSQTDAQAAEITTTIDRKTIRAPFSGLLGIRQVSVGQYVAPGDPIVQLQSLDPIYVNFGVPQQDASRLAVGRRVQVAVGESGGPELSGRISAIDAVVNEATRNVQVQATLANPNGKLRPGMFVQVDVGLGASRTVVALPAPSISYAPYGDSVYVVADVKGPNGETYRGVRQQFVKLGPSRGDQVAVLEGLEAGAEVVTSGVFKLRNGAAVQVNNRVLPANSTTPALEDR